MLLLIVKIALNNKMNKRKKLESENDQTILGLLIFFAYLIYCAFIPNLVNNKIDYKVLVLIQVMISSLFLYHWYSRIDYLKVYSGPISNVYAEIDSTQFKYTQYLNLGVKTKPPFINGFFDKQKAAKILSNRYDIICLIISLCGEALIFMTHADKVISRKMIFKFLVNDYPFGINIIAGAGGYIFLVGFSLFSLGFVSRIIGLKDKKFNSNTEPT
jgi:hypothetical protein